MFRWLSDGFCNIRVNAKLSLGFGTVLLLTMVIASAGWYSTQTIVERSDKISQISDINGLITSLGAQYARYQRQHDAPSAARLIETLERIDAQQNKLTAVLNAPEERQLLSVQRGILKDYRAHLVSIGESFAHRDSAFTTLNRSLGLASKQLNDVVNNVVQSPATSQQGFMTLQTIRQLFQGIQQLMIEVYGYDYSNDPEKGRSALAGSQLIIDSVARLSAASAGEQQLNLQHAVATLLQYREQLQDFANEVAISEAAGAQLFAASARLEALSQELIDYQTSKRANDLRSARQLMLVSLGLAIALGFAATAFITRQVVKPLLETLKLAERIASGDLRHDAGTLRRDELGQLQRNMQCMVINLRNVIDKLGGGVMQIATAAERFSTITRQTSAGIHTQKNETEQVASAMTEMTATVQAVARNAEDALTAAVAADQQAQAGEDVIGQVIEQIERHAIEVEKTTTAMARLKDESDKIGSVLDVIRAVAMQTNLLALNAAIEAARAGDAGRGFAVVADEVRSLAQRTQQSTEEIESLIVSLQNGTDDVASVLESSRALTISSVDLTRRAGTSLKDIAATVSAIQLMNQQIATAAGQQALVAEEINRSVLNVRDITQHTADASDHTASSSAELAELGKQLELIVGQFQT